MGKIYYAVIIENLLQPNRRITKTSGNPEIRQQIVWRIPLCKCLLI